MMSHESNSNAENVRFMSFKCPDTAALCKQSGRPSDIQPSTYVVILNQENESTKPVSQSDQQTLGTRPTGLVCKSKSKSRVSLSPNDDLKLNLTNGFDNYDSSCISQKVFQDDSEGAKSDRFGETTKIIRLKIPSSLQKAMQISQKLNAQRLLAETSINQQSNIKAHVNSTAKSSPLAESGYSSANSSCFSRESFETPSPVSMPSRHQTARQIFDKSAMDLLKEKPSHTSPSVFTPSPISSLSSGLRNVAVFQSSPSFSPNQSNAENSLNLQRTSTPRSGYVVESADGQKFILPVDPQQTKTVSVSKSDSHINIKPLSMTQFIPNSNSNYKPEVKNIKQQSFFMESSDSKIEAQILPNKNPFCESIGNSQSKLSDSAQLKSTLEMSKNPTTSSQQQECMSSFSMITQEKVGDVIIRCGLKDDENVVKVELTNDDVTDKAAESQESMDSLPNSQESSEKDSLNDSLTNIQWLGGIQLKEDGKPQMPATQNKKDNAIQWRCLSHSEVLKIAKEYGRAKRPPFSYMTLIQMALNSTEDKRMTLRQICKWIEEIFPYYKCTAKPGWKNSIRHNLSLYSIFEREKSKKHGSYWTIREDCPEKSKVVPSKEKRDASSTMSSCLPVFLPHQSSRTPKLPIPAQYRANPDSLKRNLQPILPRPNSFNSAMQTFALIPIQSMNQSQGMSNTSGRPMLIQVPTQPPPTLSQDPRKDTENLPMVDKRTDQSKKKVVNIAPKFISQNIVKQAWLNAQVGSDNECKSDTGTKEEISGDDSGAKRKKQNNGLPKPRIYPRSSPHRKQQSRRKQKLVPKERDLLQDSSDDNEDEDDVKQFINKLEQNLPTPLRAILDDSDTEKVTTSTPMKKASGSPELPSPIRGITPLKGVSLLDSSFLDGFKDLDEGRNPFASPNFMLNMKKMSPSLMRSPNTSQFENLFSGLTPIKGDLDSSNNENLSRILSEFPLDGIESEDEMLTGNLSNMNWSAICQNINSTPNEKSKME